ncbi:hypothetical protein [uncultured Enterovirga sp.]|uniref:hypothetical protein n=1 Tax=uncultured Enterovirga sp. TaxID=2026352 RepID=UPI0035CA0746
MTFHLNQTGTVRRPGFEVSVADFKQRASDGLVFWRGLFIGLVAGSVITYWLGGYIASLLR